ncbi:MAG: M15 family metallopeptidase [Actinomycetota bacterium]|nr:M15 family metallopeptidase [Actinomycetota bacterium]
MAPHQIALRRRFVALVLVLSVAIAGFLLWPARDASPVRSDLIEGSSQRYSGPDNYLAWVPGGFEDPRFRQKMERLAGLDGAVVIAGDTLWLRKTEDADGRVVHEPTRPYAFPIDAFAVQARDYAPFVAESVRGEIVRALSSGKAVLGEHSARLRRLGPGGKLTFRTGSVRVGAIVPDDAVGWAEALLSREVGRRLGITHERYLLAQPSRNLTRPAWKRTLLPFVGDDPLRVDVPGGTRFVRVASGVNPPILVKEVFGEFAATPQSDPAWLTIDPAWVERNIVTTEVPLLGTVTCHRRLIPMVKGALEEILASGLMSEIKVYSGCWASRTVSRSPTAPPSFHAYGAAIDINAPQNPYGAKPTMNREVVRIFESWGFNWGGDFLIPDGHHFEYWRFPDQLRSS